MDLTKLQDKIKGIFSSVKGKNPKPVLEAVTEPSRIFPIAKFALLERVNSPIIYRDISVLMENVKATYLYSLPMEEAVRHIGTLEDDALVWLEKVGQKEYEKLFTELVHEVCKFWNMMPSSEKKKTEERKSSETDGLAKS